MMWNADLAWVLIAGGFVLIALMLQRMLLNGLKPQKLVGDESEYLRLANGKRDNTLWVRVPLGATGCRSLVVLSPLANRPPDDSGAGRNFICVVGDRRVDNVVRLSSWRAGGGADRRDACPSMRRARCAGHPPLVRHRPWPMAFIAV